MSAVGGAHVPEGRSGAMTELKRVAAGPPMASGRTYTPGGNIRGAMKISKLVNRGGEGRVVQPVDQERRSRLYDRVGRFAVKECGNQVGWS